MISTLHTAAEVDDWSRCTGITNKKPQYIHYNTHMHGVDKADQHLACYPFICKTVKWPKKVFFYLLQCALFNSYVIFTKSNPNSHKSYLVDVNENLIHTREDVSTPSSSSDKSQDSSRTPTPTPSKRAPKSDPPGRRDGKLKNHKLMHIPLPRKTRHLQEDVKEVYGKISRNKRDLFAHIAVFLSIQKAAT
jgi:hypothetical protein